MSHGQNDGDEQSFCQGRTRRPIGSLSYITGIFGLLAAYEVIKIIIPLPSKILTTKKDVFGGLEHLNNK